MDRRNRGTAAALTDPAKGPRGGARCLWLLGAVAAALALASGAVATPGRTGGDLARQLRHGSVRLTGARVVGDLSLRGTVAHAFVCRECRFTGDVDAQGGRFRSVLDLTGSVFEGKLNLAGATLARGLEASGATFGGIVDLRRTRVGGPTDFSEATFDAPVLGGSAPTKPDRRTTFDGTVDFSLATFRDLVSLENSDFERPTVFRLARFGSDAVFAGGCYGACTPQAPRGSEATASPIDFSRATFRRSADFSNFTFVGPSDFAGAQFGGPADYTLATFEGALTFDGAHFRGGATFLNAVVPALPHGVATYDTFRHVEVIGNLTFAFAQLSRPIDFEDASATGIFSFDDARLAAPLSLSDVSATDFRMPVTSVMTAVPPDLRRPILVLIESSAKARGDLGTANQAQYLADVLRSRHYSTVVRMLDIAVYRWTFGYLVRPLRPLGALLLLAALWTFARAAADRRESARMLWEQRRQGVPRFGVGALLVASLGALGLAGHHRSAAVLFGLHRVVPRLAWRTTRRLVVVGLDATLALLATLSLIGPGRGDGEASRGRQAEVLLYRVLFASILIGLANSNPTLRQMFDAFH